MKAFLQSGTSVGIDFVYTHMCCIDALLPFTTPVGIYTVEQDHCLKINYLSCCFEYLAGTVLHIIV